MTDFQMSLIAAGGVFVVGVISYNKWQEYKARKSVERAFSHDHDDVLMKGGAAPERAYAQDDMRHEPVLDGAPEPRHDVLTEPAIHTEPLQHAEQPFHERESGAEPAVDIDGADHRFRDVAQNGVLVGATGARFAVAEVELGAEVQLAGDGGAGLLAHEGVESAAEVALVGAREFPVDHVGDDQAEHPVAEELQPLIGVRDPPGRSDGAGMRQRGFQIRGRTAGRKEVEKARNQIQRSKHSQHDLDRAARIARLHLQHFTKTREHNLLSPCSGIAVPTALAEANC